MCCNRPRQAISNTTRRAPAFVNPQPGAPLPAHTLPHPVFQYVGDTALTIVSPVTRKVYRFERPGARVVVDVRDRSWVAFVPNLVREG